MIVPLVVHNLRVHGQKKSRVEKYCLGIFGSAFSMQNLQQSQDTYMSSSLLKSRTAPLSALVANIA